MIFKTEKFCLAILYGVFLASCASDSGVLNVGNNKYIITKQAATGFNASDMRPDLISRAAQHCQSTNKNFELIGVEQNSGPYIFGNFPKGQIEFWCR